MATRRERASFLHLRADPEVKCRFRARCRERGVTQTWVVQRAVEEFLAGRWDPTVPRR